MYLDDTPLYDAYTPHIAPPRRVGQSVGFWQKGAGVLTNASGKQGGAVAMGQIDFAALMLRVRNAQDRGAFAEIFQHFAPRVKGFLMKSGSDAALAEELAQDVMATVWHKSAQFDPARASLATWIFTIARNRRVDHFRRSRRPEPEDLDWGPDYDPDAAEIYQAAEESRRLSAALTTLPEPQRALIERAYFGDLSHSEIAAQTGLPLGTIKSRIRLALERLRQNMNRA
jgi:RNA polymerase sigma-70 factor (ECF subfamily)